MKKWIVEDWSFELTAIKGEARGQICVFIRRSCGNISESYDRAVHVVRGDSLWRRLHISRREKQIRNDTAMPLRMYCVSP